MANNTIGSIMIREIIRMKKHGFGNSEIAKTLGKSRSTIVKYSNGIRESGLTLDELLRLPDERLNDLIESINTPPKNQQIMHSELYEFFPYVEKELKRVGVTRQMLWEEYKEKYPEGLMSSQFNMHYNKWLLKTEGYMPAVYKVGEKAFVDYAGKKLPIIDRETGEITEVQVLLVTLASSQYTYIEASFSQKLPDFINSVQNAFHFFGGVPACIIPDNLKSAVTTADRIEPFLNEQFAAFAGHYDTFVMPTRPIRPKDKSLVEGAVNNAYTKIYAPLRNREFYSLGALNKAIRELLPAYNDPQFQKKQSSRTELFLELEKPALRALPTERYELRKYKVVTVEKNCHVHYSPDKNYYSVPHTLVKTQVKLIVTQSTVEVYKDFKRVAFHPRSRKPYAYTTLKEHMPVSHTYKSDWSPEYFLNWAKNIGPSVEEAIRILLNRNEYYEQNYKSCMGVLSMAKKTSKKRLNDACKRALAYEAVSYKRIQNILDKGLDQQTYLLEEKEVEPIKHENIRGSKYYT